MKPLFRRPVHNLTPLYCLHQGAVSFAYAGIASFAVAYLMSRGFNPALIGAMLAATSILSCVLQPLIGSYVDRRSMTLLPGMILGFQSLVFVCLAAIEALPLPMPLIGVLFTAGYLSFLMALSLNNSLCAHYSQTALPSTTAWAQAWARLHFRWARWASAMWRDGWANAGPS